MHQTNRMPLVPHRLRSALRWEGVLAARLLLQRLSPRYHRTLRDWRRRKDVRLNLGCFQTRHPGWLNIDAVRTPAVDFICDIRRPVPLPAACARYIFCEHVLEHLDYFDEVPRFLRECYRLLAPGGVLRVVVPDAAKYMEACLAEDWDRSRQLRDLAKYGTLMEMVNDVFRQDGQHLFAYDATTLRRVIEHAGFSNPTIKPCGVSDHEGLAIEQAWRAEESLHIEAVRP